jgi:outer membrane protein, multidrug efflux system
MMSMRYAVLTIGLLLLSACLPRITEHEPVAVVELPEHWRGGAKAGTPQPWALAFDQPQLLALIDEALVHNWNLQAAAARMRAALVAVDEAGAARKPSVNYDLGADRPLVNDNEFLDDADVTYSASLSASWELDLWRRLGDQQETARQQAKAQAAEFAWARLSLAARVARTWYQIANVQLQAEAATTYRDNLATAERFVVGRYLADEVPASDLHLLRSELAQADADLERWRRQLDGLQRSLEILLGRYPAAEVASVAQLPEPPAIAAGVPSEVLLRRPDIQAQAKRLLANNAELRAARKDLLPRFSLTVRGGIASPELSDLIDPTHILWSLGASLFGPLYDGGRRRAVVARQQAGADAELAILQHLLLQALSEVETALAADRYLQQELSAQQAAASNIDKAVATLSARYDSGIGDALNLLQTTRQAILRRSRVLTLQQDRLLNHIDLALALGGPVRPVKEDAP